MDGDPHAERRDEKRRKQQQFVSDNRRSVRDIQRRRLGDKHNKPQRGGVREWTPEEDANE